jgi:hypothetical protein
MINPKRPSHDIHCVFPGEHIVFWMTLTPVPSGQHVSVLVTVPQVTHVPPLQSAVKQSAFPLHVAPAAHLPHVGPPQSTPVSSASLTPSEQCEVVHVPRPSQTSPP